jgi:hypothetical protein
MTLIDLTPTTAAAMLTGLALAGGLLALAASPAGSSRRMRQRITRTTQGIGAPRAAREQTLIPTTVRRRNARTLLGQKGNSLVHLLPRSDALRHRLDKAGLPLNVIDCALLCVVAGSGPLRSAE